MPRNTPSRPSRHAPRRGAFAAALSRARALRSNQDGNVAILFAISSIPLLALTGAGIDYGLGTKLHSKLQAATDSTALALCQAANTTTVVQLQLQANALMTGYMGAAGLTVDPVLITTLTQFPSNPRQITLKTHISTGTFFSKVTGVATMRPGATSTCAQPIPQTFEIALVLDNTGSMAASGGGQSKMDAAKQAASNFVDYIYGNSTTFAPTTRISVTPFAAAVAVDPTTYRLAGWIDQLGRSNYHWTNVLGRGSAGFQSRFDIFNSLQNAVPTWGWAGCLESLPYPLNVQDGAPTSDPSSLYIPMFAPDEPGNGSTGTQCFRDQNDSTYTTLNSYLNDSTTAADCSTRSGAFNPVEGKAAKYLTSVGASPTANVAGTGIPNGPNFMCTTKPLLRLTNDTSALKNKITSMAALGSTNIHEGFMWGWRTLSPKSVFADGAPYSASTVNKIMILMTDGANSWNDWSYSPNKSLYSAMGYFQNADGTSANPHLPPAHQNLTDAASARTALDALTAQACTNAKAAGVSIYTIGFSVPSDPIDSAGQTLLRNCASSPGQAFIANDSNQLIAQFNQIAGAIGKLRLTN